MNGSIGVAGRSEPASESAQTPERVGVQAGSTASNAEQLHETVAVAAYYFAQARDFEAGHEMDDWLKAEAQVLASAEQLKRAA